MQPYPPENDRDVNESKRRRAETERVPFGQPSEYMPKGLAGYVSIVYRLCESPSLPEQFWHRHSSVLRDLFDWNWLPSEAAKIIKGESL